MVREQRTGFQGQFRNLAAGIPLEDDGIRGQQRNIQGFFIVSISRNNTGRRRRI